LSRAIKNTGFKYHKWLAYNKGSDIQGSEVKHKYSVTWKMIIKLRKWIWNQFQKYTFVMYIKFCVISPGMFFFLVIYQISDYFSLDYFLTQSSRTLSEQVKNDHFEKRCRWFQLFFIDCHFFLFSCQNHPC
jgi:hypothetical protein